MQQEEIKTPESEQKKSELRGSQNMHKLWSSVQKVETTSVKDWLENFKKPNHIKRVHAFTLMRPL